MSVFSFNKCVALCRKFKNGGFLVLCAVMAYVVGYQVGFRSWSQKVSVLVDPKTSVRGLASTGGESERQIASIDYDIYSNVQNIFKNAQVISSGNIIQFVVGNVLYNDPQGNQQFICDVFSKIRLIFEAYRISMEGEKVIMQMISPCNKHSDFKFIGPFNLPKRAIQNSPISLTDFESGGGSVHFHNVSISWPKRWILMRAEFLESSKIEPHVIHIEPPKSEEDVFLIEF